MIAIAALVALASVWYAKKALGKRDRYAQVLRLKTHSVAPCGCDFVEGRIRTPCAEHRDPSR